MLQSDIARDISPFTCPTYTPVTLPRFPAHHGLTSSFNQFWTVGNSTNDWVAMSSEFSGPDQSSPAELWVRCTVDAVSSPLRYLLGSSMLSCSDGLICRSSKPRVSSFRLWEYFNSKYKVMFTGRGLLQLLFVISKRHPGLVWWKGPAIDQLRILCTSHEMKMEIRDGSEHTCWQPHGWNRSFYSCVLFPHREAYGKLALTKLRLAHHRTV